MAALIGKFGTYPPSKGWDLTKIKMLAFKPMAEQDEDENEYLSMWLATTPKAEVMGRLSEWEASDPNRPGATAPAEDTSTVGKALYYTEDDVKNGRVNPDDLAR